MTATDFLAIAGGDRPALVAAKIDGLRKFILAFGAARSWLWLILGAELDPLALVLSGIALTVAAGLAWAPGRAHWAARLAVPFLLLQLVSGFPLADNHFVLEVVVVALLALVGREREFESEVLQGILWVSALVLFHTGLQKILYGLYFRGEFLAFMVGQGGRFSDLFAWMLSPEDVAALAAHDPLRSGAGPYLVSSTLFVVLSNAIYLAEIALAPLLLWRRTRVLAALAALALVLLIQLGAREVGFALLFSNLLLLFLGRAVGRALVPVFAALLVWAVLAALGVLPGSDWIDRGYL